MTERIFKPGDKVRITDTWLNEHPDTPLRGIVIVGTPGQYAEPGEIAFSLHGNTFYVPAEFVSHAESEGAP